MGFSQKVIDAVWGKLKKLDEKNESNGFRKDAQTAWIKKSAYGNRKSIYGWEIDHITPTSKEEDDDLDNLRALHWKNNLFKSDGHLKPNNKVYSQGKENFIMEDGVARKFMI